MPGTGESGCGRCNTGGESGTLYSYIFTQKCLLSLWKTQNKTAAWLTLAKGVAAFELHYELLFLLAQNCCHMNVILLISVFLGEEVVGVMYFGQGKRFKCSLVIVICETLWSLIVLKVFFLSFSDWSHGAILCCWGSSPPHVLPSGHSAKWNR